MKKIYEAPELFVDEYVADTMIASSGSDNFIYSDPEGEDGGGPKNNNAGNNQNCWGYNCIPGVAEDGQNACLGYPGSAYCR